MLYNRVPKGALPIHFFTQAARLAKSYRMKYDNSPRLLSIFDQFPSAVVVIGVAAVLVTDRSYHVFLRHRALGVHFCLRHCQVVVQLDFPTSCCRHIV